ncbi:MAG: hypothetical protein KDA91_15640 [Planctomycetaceae bacterium]|nr:hypothetical protein [Planctomycetaceae bacterium]
MPTKTNSSTSVVAQVAGEDVRAGDYITVLNEVVELPSFLWGCSETSFPPDEMVRTRQIPDIAGQPFRVVEVCLPFVYARQPNRSLTTFDTRQHQLVRMKRRTGQLVWKEFRKHFRNSRK